MEHACDVRVEVHVLDGDEGDAGFTGEDELELFEAGPHMCPPLIEEDWLAAVCHVGPRQIAARLAFRA